ncbi:3-deoxy-manno-octulosonate cytidylyltransferase [uncultured archaeon]|nr:3-deoxy-manno-octulosonate cytidylyltransferase [uncultured archaeon]
MNCDIFIPVRLLSTRLPNKAMLEINGKPIIKYLIERLKKAKSVRNIVVCTTMHESDNNLVRFLEKENIMVFRGSDKDILVRFLDAAKKFHTDFIVSVDGDDIYSDPQYVDQMVTEFQKTGADYMQVLGVPVGFTPFGIKTSALEKICKLKKTDNTETGYGRFFTETNLFNKKNLDPKLTIRFPTNLRLSLDYQEDFEVATEIFKSLGNNFHIEDVLKLLNERPDLLVKINDLEGRWNEHWNKNLADSSIRDI